jgi:hypothetical protein
MTEAKMEFLKPIYDEELNSEGDVEIVGSVFARSRILGELEPQTYSLTFAEWVEERKTHLILKADEILKQYDNKNRFEQLKKSFKAGTTIPFVGAGMSFPSGYPTWTTFLYQLCEESHVQKDELDRLVGAGDYEQAASVLHDDLGAALFNENLEGVFSSEKEIVGPIHYLPVLFPGSTVITTNYDRLLERVYKGSEYGFDVVKYGKSLSEVVRLMANGNRMLLKLHGECDQVTDRVLLKVEYEAAYVNGDTVSDFFSRVLFAKSLLFLGCSLCTDRTFENMVAMVTKYKSETLPRHYAFLELKEANDRVARKKELAAANIFPIWYSEGEHDESIEALFVKLMEN